MDHFLGTWLFSSVDGKEEEVLRAIGFADKGPVTDELVAKKMSEPDDVTFLNYACNKNKYKTFHMFVPQLTFELGKETVTPQGQRATVTFSDNTLTEVYENGEASMTIVRKVDKDMMTSTCSVGDVSCVYQHKSEDCCRKRSGESA